MPRFIDYVKAACSLGSAEADTRGIENLIWVWKRADGGSLKSISCSEAKKGEKTLVMGARRVFGLWGVFEEGILREF